MLPGLMGSPENPLHYLVPAAMHGWRLDRALAHLSASISRLSARQAITEGLVSLAGCSCRDPRRKVATGSIISLQGLPSRQFPDPAAPACIPLAIVDEDEDLLVIDKPPGLVAHPGRGNRAGTLANALAHYRPVQAQLPRCGLVHRLDKDTSGLIVAAKNERSLVKLQRQFGAKTASRAYLAIVYGTPAATGEIARALGRDPGNRLRMMVRSDGQPALTRYHVLRSGLGATLIRCILGSGRTHQIRVHLENIGHPVLGDRVYRRHALAPASAWPRQMLHAADLELLHPGRDERVSWHSPTPTDFAAVLSATGLT